MSEKPFEDRLEQAKRASVGQLLMRCSRLYNEKGIARFQKYFDIRLRAAHTSLMPHIDLAGTRLTEIARRMGVSKQAVGQLAEELVEAGFLERVKDPEDGRAKLIRFSEKGRETMMLGLGVLTDLDKEYRARIGDAHMDNLHAALIALQDALDADETSDPNGSEPHS